MKPAVFLDRDGVLIEEVNLLQRASDIRILRLVPEALRKLHQAGFVLIIISNQPIVARGLLAEKDVHDLHRKVLDALDLQGAPSFHASYFCFHHPDARVVRYRVNCDCRKPGPGLLLAAGKDHRIDMTKSFIIGDRITDVMAGAKAGIRTILVESGAHLAPLIRSHEQIDVSVRPDYQCQGLCDAADWILRQGL